MKNDMLDLSLSVHSAFECFKTMSIYEDCIKVEGNYDRVQRYVDAKEELRKRLSEAATIIDRLEQK